MTIYDPAGQPLAARDRGLEAVALGLDDHARALSDAAKLFRAGAAKRAVQQVTLVNDALPSYLNRCPHCGMPLV